MKNVFDYITSEEANYKTKPVTVADGYEWSMPEHIRKCILYRDSRFASGANDNSRPFKNIVRRIVNLQHYATGFDVKDIQPFVDDSDKYHLSFLTRKYHAKWARKNNIDTYIDQKVESYVDFGGALSKHGKGVAAEIVQLATIAFCDQTDILSGPICIKHNYSPDQLREFDGKWKRIEEVITLARDSKSEASLAGVNTTVTKTPGKYIEVYELDGTFSQAWLKEYQEQEVTEDDEKTYNRQLWIVTFYKDEKGDKQGIILFGGKGDTTKYKFIARDPIFGRALGMSTIEELFEAQVWTNYNMIRVQEMLDVASKIVFQTADKSFATRQKLGEVDNGEFLTHEDQKSAERLDNEPTNYQFFERMLGVWGEHAQEIGAAGDAILGENAKAGDPFVLQQFNAQQQANIHEYRKGKLAVSLAEEYRDWYLKDLADAMQDEQEFLEELSLDELEYVAGCVSRYEEAQFRKRELIAGRSENLNPQALGAYKAQAKQRVKTQGGKQFFKLLQGEFKRIPTDVYIDIGGKQKNLGAASGLLVNLAKLLIANPAAPQTKSVATLINQAIEYIGLPQIDFTQDQPQSAGPRVSESISFKDLPPEGQQQMAAQAGIKIDSVPSPLSPAPQEGMTAGAA